jgi:membrane protein required for colicin V production
MKHFAEITREHSDTASRDTALCPFSRTFLPHARRLLFEVWMVQINLFDISAVVLIIVFMVHGFFQGLLNEAAGIIGLITALYLARRCQNMVEPHMVYFLGKGAWTSGFTYLLGFLAVLFLVALLVALIRKVVMVTIPPVLDHILGGLSGLCKGMLLCTGLFYVATRFLPPITGLGQAMLTPFFLIMIDYLRNLLPANLG